MIGYVGDDPRVNATIGALRGAFDGAAASVQRRRAAFTAIGQLSALAGVDPRQAAAALIPRAAVADSVWQRIDRAVRELDAGRAVLWNHAGNWLVVPRAVVPTDASFLGGWQIVVIGVGIAALVIAAIVGAALLTNYWLEVRAAEAQNDRLRVDALTKAQELVNVACASGDPARCERATAVYRAVAAGLAPPDSSSPWPAAAAGAGGLALGVLLMMFLSSRRR